MTATGSAEVEVAGERLVLLPEMAAYWPRRAMLLVADAHFGKAATFRASGLPVPSGTTAGSLERLESALARATASSVVFLGDFLHAREGRAPDTLKAVADWRHARGQLDVVLVRGNHDRRAGDPPPELGVRCVDAPLVAPPFALAHHPVPVEGAYVLAGHLHPGMRLSGAGGFRARVPCFWIGTHVGVLPAFGEFTGLATIEPVSGDRVFAVAGQEVMEIAVREGAEAGRRPDRGP